MTKTRDEHGGPIALVILACAESVFLQNLVQRNDKRSAGAFYLIGELLACQKGALDGLVWAPPTVGQ